MKSTYKLLGVFWDRKEIAEKNFPVVGNCKRILDYRYELELFDVKTCFRKIRISELLNAEKEDMVKKVVNKLKLCDKIIAVIDYFPRVKNEILYKFARKRILQILNYLQREIPKAKICVSRKF